MKHKIVITRHRPWLRWILTSIVTVTLAVGAWALYSYTRATTVSEFEATQTALQRLQDERRDLRAQLREALSEKDRLSEQVVYLEQSQDIDKQACEEVKTSLKKLQGEVSDLHEQVAFYRGIVSPTEAKGGVRIYDLKIHPTATAGTFRYELVLIQSARYDRRIAGDVKFAIQGTREGTSATLPLSELALDKSRSFVFSFKYFQEFSGEFRLPPDFRPARVMVSVIPEGADHASVEDAFDWAKIQAGRGNVQG